MMKYIILAFLSFSSVFAETPPPYEPTFPVEDLIGKPTPQTDRFLSEFLNMLATLGLIIALILLAAWFLRRMVNTRLEQANLSSVVKILEHRSISPKTSLFLLDIEGSAILIAESANGVTKLGEFALPNEEVESAESSTFKNLMDKK